MTHPSTESERRSALRRIFVAQADSVVSRRRFPVFAGVAAFALAGALSGAGVAAAAGSSDGDITRGERIAGLTAISPPGTGVIGPAFAYRGTGAARFQLGDPPPAGADALASWIRCDNALSWSEYLDGDRVSWGSCPAGQRSGGTQPIARSYELRPRSEGVYTVVVGWVDLPEAPVASAAQKAAVADGLVTREEYVAGSNRYLGCMNAAGHGPGNVDQSAEVFDMAIAEAGVLDGSNDRCYESEFAEIDIEWQLSRE